MSGEEARRSLLSSSVLTGKKRSPVSRSLFIRCQEGHSRGGHAQTASARSCSASKRCPTSRTLTFKSLSVDIIYRGEQCWYETIVAKWVLTNNYIDAAIMRHQGWCGTERFYCVVEAENQRERESEQVSKFQEYWRGVKLKGFSASWV